jgi:hypothetical protein
MTNPEPQDPALQTLLSIPDLANHEISGVLLVLKNPDNEYSMAQLRPTKKATPALLQVGQSATNRYQDCEMIDYAPATDCVGKQIMWMALSDVPLLQSIIDDSADLANVDLFDPKKQKLAQSRLTAIRVDADTGPIVFIQSMAGSQVVARSTKIGVLLREGVIDVPSGELVLLNEGVTAISAGQFVFFSNRASFQKLFGILEELRAQAEATFREVTGDLRIEGFEEMLAAVTSQTQMVSKMASIRSKIQQFPKYKEALTMPKLLAFVESHPECKVEVAGEGDEAKLVFRSDAQHRFKILKLLDDDYLRSELTTLGYESNSKGLPIVG